VLVSGIDDSPIFDWSPRVQSAIEAAGAEAHRIDVLPWAPVPGRAQDLWSSLASLRDHIHAPKINLVCYAVGGLDCRYVASPNGLFKDDPGSYADVRNAIASITTIATPHRGTRVAEAALSALENGTADDILQTLVGAWGHQENVGIPDHAALAETLRGLTLEAAAERNHDLVDADGIFYQSWAGVSQVLGETSEASEKSIRTHCAGPDGALLLQRHEGTRDAMNPLLYITAPFSGTSLDDSGAVVTSPSDGMVSVESAKWGEFRGCIPADHYKGIAQPGLMTRDPLTGFDAPAFYAWLAGDLAERGF
jgi:triacylglycerol lipase